MQPGMAGLFGAVWQQVVVGVPAATAGDAATRRGADRIAVQPFDNAAFEGACLGLRTRQSAIEFDNANAFVKVSLPVLGRPSVAAGPQQCHDLGLVPGKRVEHRGGGCGGCAQRKIVAIEKYFDTGGAGALHGIGRVHIRDCQPRQFYRPTRWKAAKALKAVI